jgi:hypothetical protein
MVSFTPLPRYRTGKNSLVSIGSKAGWAPEAVTWQGRKRKILHFLESKSGRPAHSLYEIIFVSAPFKVLSCMSKHS